MTSALSLRVGAAQRMAPGESVCGDAYVVVEQGTRVLIALADGLGHGPHAESAATQFCRFIAASAEEDLQALFFAAHRDLGGTRGVAAALLRVDLASATLCFAGVGNVELVAMSRHPIAPAPASGIVGGRLRRVTTYEYPLVRGDLLVAYTDGLARPSNLAELRDMTPRDTAEAILRSAASGRDDATCVVARL